MSGLDHSSRSLFAESVPSGLRLLGWIILTVILMLADYKLHWLNQIRIEMSGVLNPVFTTLELPSLALKHSKNWLESHSDLLEINETLINENLLLQTQLKRLHQLESENTELRQLLQAKSKIPYTQQTAQVLDVKVNPLSLQLLIDKGTDDQVNIGMVAVDQSGIIGQIIGAGTKQSWLMLIADPAHALPVQIQRTQVRTVIQGLGKMNQLSVSDFPLSGDIQAGDILESSGLGGRFPPGYPVATVTEVIKPEGARFATVFARPASQLDTLNHMVIVDVEGNG